MARQGISKEQVYAAASDLRDEGVAPTVQAVRARIGSGSYSTINTHLATWKAEAADQALGDIPVVPDKVQDAFNRIWATAARSAQEDVEAQRDALETMRREIDKDRASMAEEIERLENDLEATTTKAARVQAELAKERESAEKQVLESFKLNIDNARLSAILDEKVKSAQAQAVFSDNALRSANAERERDLVAYERDRDVWENELERERKKSAQMQEELECERGDLEEAVSLARKLDAINARLDERVASAEARGIELKDQLGSLQAKYEDLAKARKPRSTAKKKAVSAPKPRSTTKKKAVSAPKPRSTTKKVAVSAPGLKVV